MGSTCSVMKKNTIKASTKTKIPTFENNKSFDGSHNAVEDSNENIFLEPYITSSDKNALVKKDNKKISILSESDITNNIMKNDKIKYIGFYFSAHWCPPCRGFTPKLTDAYNKNLKNKGLEIIFVSCDQDNKQFEEYYFSMANWLAVNYSNKIVEKNLSEKFNVNGIPAFIVLDKKTMKVMYTDARSKVMQDPTGDSWLIDESIKSSNVDDKSLINENKNSSNDNNIITLLEPYITSSDKDALVKKDNKKIDVLSESDIINNIIKNDNIKYIGFYFSAHWCPPCRGFTPKLSEAYNKDLKNKGLEIIFVSSDQGQKQFEDYYLSMANWLALNYSNRDLKAKLGNDFEVRGIPYFVILDKKTMKIVHKDGRAKVMEDPTGKWLL